LVEVLEDFLAALVFEVDVDVGGLVAGGGDEALEEQVDLGGVDAGDAEAVADGGVGGGASALAEDAAGAGKGDEVVDGEEVGFEVELLDEGELVVEELTDGLGDAGRSQKPEVRSQKVGSWKLRVGRWTFCI
jgi:hypothetical protein